MKPSTRMLALEWWKSKDNIQKEIEARLWKAELPDDDFRRKWDYQMIAMSSSCIEAIYTFIHS